MLLSIIIPVYNRQHTLELLLSTLSLAIIKGGFEKKVEIIIVDDDSSPPITLADAKFVNALYNLPQNSGAPKARELGFQKSTGQFIHFHDSDDGVEQGWLASVIHELEANPELDILLTGRNDISQEGSRYRYQKHFDRHVNSPEKIKQRLVYRNCMGPLGGVTFSRRVLEKISFKSFLSCQDWQMYLEAIEHAKVLKSCPQIKYRFNVSGDDRISHNPTKKLIGHLQLSKITAPKSPFKKNIRLFYLITCKPHIFNKQGMMLAFYKKNRLKLWFNYALISIYWRLH